MQQPTVYQGQRILWFPHVGHNAPHVAIVTRVNPRTINVTLIQEDVRTLIPRDGVHHCTDDLAKKPELQANGCWDYTEEDKQRQALQLTVAALCKEVGELKAKIKDLEGAVAAV